MSMQERLLFVISPPRAGSTLLQRMLGSHSQIFTYPEPHLITPLAYLGYYDLVDKAPYDHINAAEAIKMFVSGLPHAEADYLDAVRAYTDTLYGRMLAPSGKRYFLDKTPAYALVLPFLTRLYPHAHYVVLTRHPVAVTSSYANSFFDGDWQAAHNFNPIAKRYVPAIARLLAAPPAHLCHVRYEQLTRQPELELRRIFAFLGLEHEPNAVNYGEHFSGVVKGRGDPLTVHTQSRPVQTSLARWKAELATDAIKRELAHDIIATLVPEDVERWGYAQSALLKEIAAIVPAAPSRAETPTRSPRRKITSYLLQRRIMLALKKDIRQRPHGRIIERIRYYCNVLLRE